MHITDVTFTDRIEAGKRLSKRLAQCEYQDPFVLGLPRGGVPVGIEVAKELDVPFDVFVSCKIGCPGHTEYGIGAITEDGTYTLDFDAVQLAGVRNRDMEDIIAKERHRVEDYVRKFRSNSELASLVNRTVILVDDGLATGITMLAAVQSMKKRPVRKVIVAAPVSSVQAFSTLSNVADQVVVLSTPTQFHAVAQYYEHFEQLTDEQVLTALESLHSV
jgi:predicted phosphoribosyltransferase